MSDADPGADEIVRDLAITNKRGLHARASAKFVQTVEGFSAEVEVSKDGQSVGGCSIMGLMMLAAAQGSTVRVAARGPQAAEVMSAIEMLLAGRFGETE